MIFLVDWVFGQHLRLAHGFTSRNELLSAGGAMKEQAVNPF